MDLSYESKDQFDHEDNLIMETYRSFAEASFTENTHSTTVSSNESSSNVKEKAYIFIFDNSKSLSEHRKTERVELEQLERFEPMNDSNNIDDNSSNSAYSDFTEVCLDLSNSNQMPPEITSIDDFQRSKEIFEESSSFGDNSNSAEDKQTESSKVCSSVQYLQEITQKSTDKDSNIKIMLVDKNQKRNIPKSSNLDNCNYKKKEKKTKTLKFSDHLKLKKKQHSFAPGCDICGILPSFVTKCKFHNDVNFLFYRRSKESAFSGKSPIITQIDQLLPKSYKLISNKYSLDEETNNIISYTSQWDIDYDVIDLDKKSNFDFGQVNDFFREFACI